MTTMLGMKRVHSCTFIKRQEPIDQTQPRPLTPSTPLFVDSYGHWKCALINASVESNISILLSRGNRFEVRPLYWVCVSTVCVQVVCVYWLCVYGLCACIDRVCVRVVCAGLGQLCSPPKCGLSVAIKNIFTAVTR